MIIYLVGLPGAGKTTIGSKLADQLSFSFLDLDSKIENSQNQAISEIFRTKGENFFREVEQKELSKTFQKENLVVSVGGGTPCFFNNMEIMNQYGTTVYLHALPNEIFSRFSDEEIAKRPLLKNGVSELVKLFKSRKSIYEKAKIKISPFEKYFFEKLVDSLS